MQSSELSTDVQLLVNQQIQSLFFVSKIRKHILALLKQMRIRCLVGKSHSFLILYKSTPQRTIKKLPVFPFFLSKLSGQKSGFAFRSGCSGYKR